MPDPLQPQQAAPAPQGVQQVQIMPGAKPGLPQGPSNVQPAAALQAQNQVLAQKTGIAPPPQPMQPQAAGMNAGEMGQPWNLRFNKPQR